MDYPTLEELDKKFEESKARLLQTAQIQVSERDKLYVSVQDPGMRSFMNSLRIPCSLIEVVDGSQEGVRGEGGAAAEADSRSGDGVA